jgi:ParB family chromosome partitioning protein
VSNLMRLLELPDEVLDLLQSATLSEGHGRALLLADDHAARRMLARRAVQEGWSVRSLEARARASNTAGAAGNGAPARGGRLSLVHPDLQDAAREIAEVLAQVLGAEVHVKAKRRGGFRAELSFASAAEARQLARRLRPRASA